VTYSCTAVSMARCIVRAAVTAALERLTCVTCSSTAGSMARYIVRAAVQLPVWQLTCAVKLLRGPCSGAVGMCVPPLPLQANTQTHACAGVLPGTKHSPPPTPHTHTYTEDKHTHNAWWASYSLIIYRCPWGALAACMCGCTVCAVPIVGCAGEPQLCSDEPLQGSQCYYMNIYCILDSIMG
jgi:hypothetical protein